MTKIEEYALVMRDIRLAQKEAKLAILKAHNMKPADLTGLERTVLNEMGADKLIQTEYGNLQTLPIGKITWKPLSNTVKEVKQQVIFIPREK